VNRFMLSDPTGQIERECADRVLKQKDVALTYALAIRDEKTVPVEWGRKGQVCIPADLLVDAGRPIPIVKP
jgi:hypothetical protein